MADDGDDGVDGVNFNLDNHIDKLVRNRDEMMRVQQNKAVAGI